MDEKVLEALRWVNATYGGRSGYNRCPEDGIAGWSTMYSLTRGLQLELGITTPSDSFGSTTLARLAALGTIDRGFDNENILNIIKHGLWCKGYPGGYGDNYSADAVSDLKWDAGINPWTDDAVPPKVFKALLTMDAYVLMAGGTAAVREVQRWLNTQYLARRDFFVIPCDRVFSRNVQKALYLAIQFELGLSDDQATGVFGPVRGKLSRRFRGQPVRPGAPRAAGRAGRLRGRGAVGGDDRSVATLARTQTASG